MAIPYLIAHLRADVDELDCEWPGCSTVMSRGMVVQLIRYAAHRTRKLVCSKHNVYTVDSDEVD